jgi:beta-fructofuranosidase
MRKDKSLWFAVAAILTVFTASIAAQPRSLAAEKQPDHTSRVPKFTFGDTLAEQEAQLETNPLLARFVESRRRNLRDPHHPIYHFVAPENRMNDPNGLCFWQGRWHLFYQGYPPEDPRQHWGHAVSDDLVHWRDLPYAIYPDPERCCFSGATFVEEDRVIAMYHGTTVGNMVAVSGDPLLLNWEKVTGEAVIPMTSPDGSSLPYRVFDPCIWKKDGAYYSLSGGTLPGPGGKRTRANFLFRSEDLAEWEYLHPFAEDDRYSLVGDDGACPYFWPIGEKHILLHFSHMSGGKYLLGDYDTQRDKLVVTDGGDFNHGPFGPGGVHAPSATPDGKGGVIVLFNMNPAKPTQGWNQIMTLPMRLTLAAPDELDRLRIEPAGDVASLRGQHQHVDARRLPANEEVVLESIKGNALEIIAEIDVKGAPMVEMNVLRSPNAEEFTRITVLPGRGYRHREYGRTHKNARQFSSVITIDNSRSSTSADVRSRVPETAQFMLARNEPLRLRVFIDHSVVEVFAGGRQYAALRVYPGRDDSLGVSLRAQGQDALLKSLDAWQMKSIHE